VKANPLSIGSIFSQVLRLVVPLFQRPYVWNKEEHWAPLWHDIRNVAERLLASQPAKPHFLGAIVLEEVSIPTAHLETRQLIDGQQRLTSIQLFLEAVCDFCAATGNDEYHKALLALTRNSHPLSKESDQVYKVWPTSVDQEDFRLVMECRSPAELRKVFGVADDSEEVGHRIADAYLFFFKVVTEWFVGAPDTFTPRLDALLAAVHKYLRIVVIDLDREDDPQLIFETLNARGTPLLPSDLIKNFLLRKAVLEGEKPDSVYKKFWQSFDKDKFWRKQVGRGHAKRHRIDIFFQYYLSVQKGEDVAVGHLYSEFQEYVRQQQVTAKETLTSVQRYAQVFKGLDDPAPDTREALFLQRLRTMEHLTAYPFLMDLFVRFAERPNEVRQVLADVESFLVRRMVCNLNSRGYNRLFLDLAKAVVKGEGKPAESVRSYFMSSDAESIRWPSDDEFRTAWLETPVYKMLRKQRVRMILEALEIQLYNPKTEKIEIKERLQIEHLMPRKWKQHWPLADDGGDKDGAEAKRGQLLHTFGNLTLLTKSLNPAVSNGPWAKKQEQILRHTALRLNSKLQDFPEWGDSQIAKRGEVLFGLAKKLWPRPAN